MSIPSLYGLSASPPVSDRVLTTPGSQNQAAVARTTSPPVEQAAPSKKTYTNEDVAKAGEAINKTIQAASQNLEFSVDKDTHTVVVKIIDQQTKQVLRQIPTEEAMDIAKSLDKLQGLLIKQTA